MRQKSFEKMNLLVECIDLFFEKNLRSPSLREIEALTNIPRATAQRYLVDMSKNGMIEYIGSNIVTPNIKSAASCGVRRLPLSGAIPCGEPCCKYEWHDEYIDFPSSLLGTGKYFVLIADGDSMSDIGIDDGDYVIVRKTSVADYGKTIVALDSEGRNTLKTLMFDKMKKRPFLHPQNKKYADIYPDVLCIQGIAEKVIKNI